MRQKLERMICLGMQKRSGTYMQKGIKQSWPFCILGLHGWSEPFLCLSQRSLQDTDKAPPVLAPGDPEEAAPEPPGPLAGCSLGMMLEAL